MKLDDRLVRAAIDFVERRFPNEEWAGAAALYTEDGQILISTAPAALNPSVELCHEVGAICEAHKLGKTVTATVCVSRDEQKCFQILTPCGVCQERFMAWGAEVEAAVPRTDDSTKWQMKKLGELQPYYWRNSLTK